MFKFSFVHLEYLAVVLFVRISVEIVTNNNTWNSRMNRFIIHKIDFKELKQTLFTI